MKTNKKGQALVMLLVFVAIGIIVTSASVVVLLVGSQSASSLEQTVGAYDLAEAGAENALIRLLRNPTYAGETLTALGGTTTITVTGTSPKVVTSVAAIGNYVRKIQVTTSEVNGVLTVVSWTEIY
jgi:hypothetical protein